MTECLEAPAPRLRIAPILDVYARLACVVFHHQDVIDGDAWLELPNLTIYVWAGRWELADAVTISLERGS